MLRFHRSSFHLGSEVSRLSKENNCDEPFLFLTLHFFDLLLSGVLCLYGSPLLFQPELFVFFRTAFKNGQMLGVQSCSQKRGGNSVSGVY